MLETVLRHLQNYMFAIGSRFNGFFFERIGNRIQDIRSKIATHK